MQFTLRTLLIYFVFVAAALGAFGGWAFLIVPWLMVLTYYCRRQRCTEAMVITVIAVVLVGLVMPASQSAPRGRRQGQCLWCLSQLAVALHNYRAAHGSFPPAYIANEDGKPMHSWRVLLLPYVKRDDLYQAYDFSKPWDSPANLEVVKDVPWGLRCPSDPSSQPTATYLAVVGPETAWPAPDSTTFADFADGASNTILLVEVADSGILWTEPRDLTLDEVLAGINVSPNEGIRSNHVGGVNVAFADGRVRFIGSELSMETLHALLTRSGGETVDLDDLDRYFPQGELPPPGLRRPFSWRSSAFATYSSLAVFLASGMLLLWTTRRGAAAG